MDNNPIAEQLKQIKAKVKRRNSWQPKATVKLISSELREAFIEKPDLKPLIEPTFNSSIVLPLLETKTPNKPKSIFLSQGKALIKGDITIARERGEKRKMTFNQKGIESYKPVIINHPSQRRRLSSIDYNSNFNQEMRGVSSTQENSVYYRTNKNELAYLDAHKKGHFIITKMFTHIKSFICKSLPGLKENGFEKINADSVLRLKEVFGFKELNIFGIADGVGPDGHLISSFLSLFLKDYFLNHPALTGKPLEDIYKAIVSNDYELLKNAFVSAEKELKKRSLEFNPYSSGATVILVIQVGNKVFSGNVGDNRAIMMNNKKIIFPLSTDHLPDSPEEKSRIVKSGGKVVQEGKRGPFKVIKEDKDYPGLYISRSIGNFDGKYLGVISDPNIGEFTLDGTFKSIVIASNGVWRYLSNEKIAEIGSNYFSSNPTSNEEFCDRIIDEASEAWELKGKGRDDISVITISL